MQEPAWLFASISLRCLHAESETDGHAWRKQADTVRLVKGRSYPSTLLSSLLVAHGPHKVSCPLMPPLSQNLLRVLCGPPELGTAILTGLVIPCAVQRSAAPRQNSVLL